MRADEAIERVRELRGFNYGSKLPAPVVIATSDWLAYVQAMASGLPDENIAYPTEEDIYWAWPDGVLIMFAEPIEVQHAIISRTNHITGRIEKMPPHYESQDAVALAIVKKQFVPADVQVGSTKVEMDDVFLYPTLWVGTDPHDIVSGHWLPGSVMRPSAEGIEISGSSRILVAIITALGHRLTRVSEPSGSRGERRRAERELPGLRVLQLASGASVKRNDLHSAVAWSHRWFVRGHWRLQPYGPGKALRKAIWIDPYVKGPEDKPLDTRETIWKKDLR